MLYTHIETNNNYLYIYMYIDLVGCAKVDFVSFAYHFRIFALVCWLCYIATKLYLCMYVLIYATVYEATYMYVIKFFEQKKWFVIHYSLLCVAQSQRCTYKYHEHWALAQGAAFSMCVCVCLRATHTYEMWNIAIIKWKQT